MLETLLKILEIDSLVKRSLVASKFEALLESKTYDEWEEVAHRNSAAVASVFKNVTTYILLGDKRCHDVGYRLQKWVVEKVLKSVSDSVYRVSHKDVQYDADSIYYHGVVGTGCPEIVGRSLVEIKLFGGRKMKHGKKGRFSNDMARASHHGIVTKGYRDEMRRCRYLVDNTEFDRVDFILAFSKHSNLQLLEGAYNYMKKAIHLAELEGLVPGVDWFGWTIEEKKLVSFDTWLERYD